MDSVTHDVITKGVFMIGSLQVMPNQNANFTRDFKPVPCDGQQNKHKCGYETDYLSEESFMCHFFKLLLSLPVAAMSICYIIFMNFH